MSGQLRNEYLAAVRAMVAAFAKERGLEFGCGEHDVEYLGVREYAGPLLRRTIVYSGWSSPELTVDASVMFDRIGAAAGTGPWAWRSFGNVDVSTPEGQSELLRLLNEAWEYLESLDPAEVRREYEAMIAHVKEHIDPVLESFASAHQARLLKPSWRSRTLVWPRARPAFRITVGAGPSEGIWLACEAKRRLGWLPLSRWEQVQEACPEAIKDWHDVAGLGPSLEEAKACLEATDARSQSR
jgi:hypothetical protein